MTKSCTGYYRLQTLFSGKRAQFPGYSHGSTILPAIVLAATVVGLEQAVNERRQRRALGDHKNQTQQQQEEHDGHDPKLFPHAKEIPEFFEDA
jgi:hypothetical protein